MAEFVGPVMEVAKLVAEPVKRQLNYLCCLSNNIQYLINEETPKLKDAKDGVQMKVDAIEREGKRVLPEVQTWLKDATEIEDLVNEIQSNTSNMSCLNVKNHYVRSREAVKISEKIDLLLANPVRSLPEISVPALPASMVAGPSKLTKEFESRKMIEESIVAALNSENINIIGICGLGGIGKTTTAERIVDLVRGEKLIDEVVKVVIGQQGSMTKVIQDSMASQLGLILDMEDLSARAHIIRTRLSDKKTRKLVIIDDVWEGLDFDDLGIIWETCKVIFTSRDENVFIGMNGLKIIKMGVLSSEEAWDLFREKAGYCVDDPNIHSLAKLVHQECKGLPLALTIVATALKDERSAHCWDDALQQLRCSNPVDIPRVLEQVYNKLKLSYDKLSINTKFIFLFCSMFPEDHDIPLEQLRSFCIGLRLFDEVLSMKQWRNKMYSLIKMLKTNSLLLDGKTEEYVKMHDVVRDMAIYVAKSSQESKLMKDLINCTEWLKENSDNECSWISLVPQGSSFEFPFDLQFPNLSFLMMKDVIFVADDKLESTENVFHGMKKLNVLSISVGTLESLPQSMQVLNNLRALHLHDCVVESISIVGKLIRLEILSCTNCSNIRELTSEVKNLSLLRSLQMSYCRNLSKIEQGIISSFTRLEELRMEDSFNEWDEQIGDERNASLTELKFLTNLSCLHISIRNLDLSRTEFKLPTKVDRFRINFLSQMRLPRAIDDCENIVILKLDTTNTLSTWIRSLLSQTEGLYLEGCCDRIHLSSQTISLSNICNSDQISASFNNLKALVINDMNSLSHLWSPYNQSITPCNLRSIRVKHCKIILSLFPLSLVINHLSQLESLRIEDCGRMGEIFFNDGEYHDDLVFHKLKDISFVQLSSLIVLSKGVQSINFIQLSSLYIDSCPNLQSLAPNLEGDSESFFNEKIAASITEIDLRSNKRLTHLWSSPYQNRITCLQKLRISGCHNLKYCSRGICLNILSELEDLKIENCFEIQEIFSCHDSGLQNCIFQKLKTLTLIHLFMLTTFHGGVQFIEFPCLEDIRIEKCPGLKSFIYNGFFDQMALFRNLKSLYIENCCNLKNGLLSSMSLQLESLRIDDCREIQEIFNEDGEIRDNNPLIFTKLRELKLDNLPSLTTFSKGLNNLEFPQLKSMQFSRCPLLQIDGFFDKKAKMPNLESLYLSDLADLKKICLSSMVLKLNYLGIMDCEQLQEIDIQKDERSYIVFPKLERLYLIQLPNLTTLGYGLQCLEFLQVKTMQIQNCPKLMSLTQESKGEYEFFNQKVIFSGLKDMELNLKDSPVCKLWNKSSAIFFNQLSTLSIAFFNNMNHLFSISIAEAFVSLKTLEISSCEQMTTIILNEDEESDNIVLLPLLYELKLTKMPRLETLCGLKHVKLPRIQWIDITDSPRMKTFKVRGSTSTQN